MSSNGALQLLIRSAFMNSMSVSQLKAIVIRSVFNAIVLGSAPARFSRKFLSLWLLLQILQAFRVLSVIFPPHTRIAHYGQCWKGLATEQTKRMSVKMRGKTH